MGLAATVTVVMTVPFDQEKCEGSRCLRLSSAPMGRTSVKYIHINDTQTMPNINIKADERTPVKSTSAPNMIGKTKPPSPPASPTTPETTPMFFGYSSEIYLKTDALPMVNMMTVKVTGLSPT